MSAGHHETQKRRFQLRVGKVIGGDVPTDMVHGNQRLPHGEGRCLGKIHADKNRTDEAWGIGHGNGIDISPGQVCLLQSLIGKTIDGFNVLPGGNFRHHTAVETVQIHLRSDTVRQDFPAVADNGNGSFVTGGFHSKNIQFSHSFLRISASSLGLR